MRRRRRRVTANGQSFSNMARSAVLAFLFSLISAVSAFQGDHAKERQFFQVLQKRRNPELPPVDANGTVKIFTKGDLKHVFHEPSRELKLMFRNFLIRWNDTRLTWNKTQYMGFFFTTNTKIDIWLPTLRTWEVGMYENLTSILIIYDGNVYVSAITNVRAACQPGPSFSLPPHSYLCSLVFIFQRYLRFQCKSHDGLVCLLGGSTMESLPVGGMWTITRLRADRPVPFSDDEVAQRVWLTLERRSEDRSIFWALLPPFLAILCAAQSLLQLSDTKRILLNALLTVGLLRAWRPLQKTTSFPLIRDSLFLNFCALLWVLASSQLRECQRKPPELLKRFIEIVARRRKWLALADFRIDRKEEIWRCVTLVTDRVFFVMWLIVIFADCI